MSRVVSMESARLYKQASDRAISDFERAVAANEGDQAVDMAALGERALRYAKSTADGGSRGTLAAIREKRNREVSGAIALFVVSVVCAAISSVVVQTLGVVGTIGSLVWLVCALWRSNSATGDVQYAAVVDAKGAADAAMVDVARRIERMISTVLEQRAERGTPPPDPQPFGVSHEGAENLVARWMQHLGAVDALTTKYSGDGGIDVLSSMDIAQVKNYQGSVGVAKVRESAGVAAVDGRAALFFTSGTDTDTEEVDAGPLALTA